MTTLADALTAYRICAKAENKSEKTISWVTDSAHYFMGFVGQSASVEQITAQDLRRFIIALQAANAFRSHRFTRPQSRPLSPETVASYVRAIKAFFSQLAREELIPENPIAKVKVPGVPTRVVPTFSAREVEKLLSQPDKGTDEGFRDYALMYTLYDTGARLSEVVKLTVDDVDLENGYLRVMRKGGKELYLPIGNKVVKVLLRYKLKHRPEPPVTTDAFWLTRDERPLPPGRVQKIVKKYGDQAGLVRCYCHKLRHSSSIQLSVAHGQNRF